MQWNCWINQKTWTNVFFISFIVTLRIKQLWKQKTQNVAGIWKKAGSFPFPPTCKILQHKLCSHYWIVMKIVIQTDKHRLCLWFVSHILFRNIRRDIVFLDEPPPLPHNFLLVKVLLAIFNFLKRHRLCMSFFCPQIW